MKNHGVSFWPWMGISALGLAFALSLTSCGTATRRAGPPVRPGVTLEGQEVGGLDRAALHQVALALAKEREVKPVNASLDSRDQSAVPGLPGWTADLTATEKAVMTSPARQAVDLVGSPVPPAVRLDQLADLPVRHGHPARHEVALTFTVAWGEEPLTDILRALDRRQVRATFFVVGAWAEDHPDFVQAMLRGGHEVAGHGYAHRHVASLPADQLRSEIVRGNEMVSALTGQKPGIFSPPYGEFNQRTLLAASQLGLRTILWSADTVDWKRPGPSVIASRVEKKVKNGGIVLMHPVDQTAQALPDILDFLTGQGYRLVTVSELIDEGRPLAPGERPSSGGIFRRGPR
jgi:probable sporulation protein (polysaccharide deacetylase family)